VLQNLSGCVERSGNYAASTAGKIQPSSIDISPLALRTVPALAQLQGGRQWEMDPGPEQLQGAREWETGPGPWRWAQARGKSEFACYPVHFHRKFHQQFVPKDWLWSTLKHQHTSNGICILGAMLPTALPGTRTAF
jgi:hypothetical protein